MVNKQRLLADERSQIYWFLSDCFAQLPSATSSTSTAEALQISPENLDILALQKEFTRLFRGIQEGYGPPPPYESLYRSAKFPTDIVEAVFSYFQTAGLDAAEICDDPVDYLSSELKLMGLLAFQEYEYLQQDNNEQAYLVRELQQKFLQNHIMTWVPEYCEMLIEASREEYYQSLARYLSSFLIDLKQAT